MPDYRALLAYAKTDSQRDALGAVIKHGSTRKAAKAIGRNVRTIDRSIARVKAHAALQGYSPEHDMDKTAPEPFFVHGVSTYYNQEGERAGQWVKTSVDREQRLRALVEVLQASFEDHAGKSPKAKAPRHCDADLLAVYPMGDPHIGMYAWADEAGEDFDVDIAARDLRGAVHDLVGRSPKAEQALILNLGDFFHSDNSSNQTARSGNPLDVDTRWARVLRLGVDLMIEVVQAALQKHGRVVVKNVIGNHDDHSAVFLSIALDKWFANNDRVRVDLSPSRFWFYRFGRVLIGSTHGDTARPGDLPGIMAADRQADWGATDYRYWYTGHIHNKQAMEFPGCLWESFRTLAAKDAWHAASGYRSGRDMQCIIHHREHGEVGRNTASITKIRTSKDAG